MIKRITSKLSRIVLVSDWFGRRTFNIHQALVSGPIAAEETVEPIEQRPESESTTRTDPMDSSRCISFSWHRTRSKLFRQFLRICGQFFFLTRTTQTVLIKNIKIMPNVLSRNTRRNKTNKVINDIDWWSFDVINNQRLCDAMRQQSFDWLQSAALSILNRSACSLLRRIVVGILPKKIYIVTMTNDTWTPQLV